MSTSEITTGHKERLSDAVQTLCKCFTNDPVLTFILNNKSRGKRLEYLPKLFHVLIKAAILNDAIVTEINEYQACAVWVPPGKKVDNWATNFQAGFFTVLWDLGFYGVRQMLFEFSNTVDAVKRVELAKYGACYYLYFVGTLPEAQGQGLGSKLIAHWQQKATAEGAAIWLEATTPSSHRLYQRLGFQDVKELTLGKGKAAADGTYQIGGPGVPLWTMIWTPTTKVQVDDSS